MDERLRKLERRAQSGDPESIRAYFRALMQTGETQAFVQTFRGLQSDQIHAFLRANTLVQLACNWHGVELMQELLRDSFMKLASQTGIWHGILPLREEEITRYNEAIRLGFFYPPPFPDLQDRRNEDWQEDQSEILYTYFRGMPEVLQMPGHQPLTIHPATWVDLNCKLGEARLGVVWKNEGDYIPDWEGVSIDSKVAGPPNQILGSYRLVTGSYYPNQLDIPELDKEMSGMDNENSELLHGDLHRTLEGTFRIEYCPEMWLHIVRCANG